MQINFSMATNSSKKQIAEKRNPKKETQKTFSKASKQSKRPKSKTTSSTQPQVKPKSQTKPTTPTKPQSAENILKKELNTLSKILSGETKLQKAQEKLEQQKLEAIKRQKSLSRNRVVSGKVKFTDQEISTEIIQNRTLFTWEAPARPPIKLNTKTFTGIVALSLLFVLYLAILGHYWLMGVIIALLFLLYVAGTSSPIIVTHKITARGVDTLNHLYEWFSLASFWFAKKNDVYMLYIETKLRVPTRLIFVVEKADLSAVFVLLEKKLLYRDIRKQGRLDKITDGDYIPLEKI